MQYPDKGELPEEWFVVYAGLIHRVMSELDRLGCPWYRPMYLAKLRHTRKYANPKTVETERALFPGYLFVAAGRGVNPKYVDGVSAVMMVSDTRYARVPNSFIDRLKDKIARRAYDDIEILKEVFKPGAAVLVKEGPFCGFQARVEALLGENKDRARILLEIFGRATPVDIDLVDVEAA